MRMRFLLLLFFATGVSAQTSFYGYGTSGMGSVLGTDVSLSYRSSNNTAYNPSFLQIGQYIMAQVSGSCTATPSFVFTCTGGGGGGASTFDQLGSGTNTTATMVLGTGSSLAPAGTGIVSANQLNGLAVPPSCLLAATNSSGQIACVNPTVESCIAVSGGQIYQSCSADPPSSFAALPACNSGQVGVRYLQTDAVFVSAAPRSAAASGGTAQIPVECMYTGTIYGWFYL